MNQAIKLLLVDDDDVDRMAIRRALADAGLTIDLTEAVDGAEALSAYESDTFDCVILDHHLPDFTGAAVFKDMLKSNVDSTGVIFLTNADDEGLALNMIEIGAIDYLSKSEISGPVLGRAVKFANARRNFLAQLTAMGQIDALTGLLNRSVFEGELRKAIAHSMRANKFVAVALLDLDNFKDINDSMGHPAGDELLKIVADRLNRITRETDIVLRLGGDEFVIISTNLMAADGGETVARKITDSLAEPFYLDQHAQHVSASVGIALAPSDGREPTELLKNADLALYRAKNEGGGKHHFYNQEMHSAAQVRRQLSLDLRRAMTREEFKLVYQPKMDAKSGAIVGVEALLRWHHPERGIVMPQDFVPIAERSQAIVEIGEWILKTASEQLMSWQRDNVPIFSCSINVSPQQLKDAKLVQAFDNTVRETGIDPTCLEIEITESAIMQDVETVATILAQLRQRGASVSIDDFGTGYSSLAILKHLPVDKLKIDRSFVSGITSDSDDAVISSTIISLSQSMGLVVIAEGVEDKAQFDFLHEKGCDQIQGFYVSRPVAAGDVAPWMHHTVSAPI